MNDFNIGFIGGLDGTKSKAKLNQDIDAIKKTLKELELKAKLDPNQVKSLETQLSTLKANLTDAKFSQSALDGMVSQINNALKGIKIPNVSVSGNTNVGQQIGNNIAQGVANGVAKATSTMKSFSQLTDSMKSISVLFNSDELIDEKNTLNEIKRIYSEFGQVKITNKVFNAGELQSFKVNIEQVNGELKETRTFMMELSDNGKFFIFPDDTIKGTEKYVQHLNAAKNATNATGEALNAQNQRLAEQAKYYGKIKEETNHLYSLKQKFLSADELQTAELEKQIKSTKQRITYNNQQLDKKGLRDNSLEREINDLIVAREKQLALSNAKAQDVANTKAQAQAQKEVNAVLKEQQALQEKVDKIQHSLNVGDYDAQIETIKKGFIGLSGDANEAETHVKGLRDALKSMHDATDDNGRLTAEKNYKLELEKKDNQLTIAKAKAKEYADVLKVQKLRNDIQDWLKKNTAATKEAKDAVKAYLDTLDDIGHVSQVTFNEAKQGLDNWDTKMRQAGKLGKSMTETFKEGMKSFTSWAISSGAVMDVWNSVKQGVEELKDLDDILTEISKTSDLTEQQLKKLGDSSFDTASKYGKKASDHLTGVQEMYRAGFDNAEEMAELSVLAQSAGDMESNSANDYIMVTNAAYDFKGSVEELNEVLDSQNYITNNAAVSMQDMADATSEAASIASQYGVEVDELSALIAVAVSKTRESGSEVGTALKALLINLQDTTSKPIKEAFDAVEISMTKMVDGSEQLKTPIELIKELSVAFNSLPEGDVKRANILNDIGGKHHANTLAAILADLDSYNSMLELYNSTSADNSAFEEAQKSANNLSGSLNKLSNTWTDTVENILNSDTLTTGVNVLNDLLGLVNKLTESLGSLGTIGVIGGGILGAKNTGREKCYPSYRICL